MPTQGSVLPFEELKNLQNQNISSQAQILDKSNLNPNPNFKEETEEESDELIQPEGIDAWDPTLDLSLYEFPSTNLLISRQINKIKITREELESNKNNIVNTLKQFKINIKSIKATIGPTVTLYEIVPDEGVKNCSY